MAIRWTGVIAFLATLLKPIIRVVTPTVKDELQDFLRKWHAKNLETENPWDDLLSGILVEIFDVEMTEEGNRRS